MNGGFAASGGASWFLCWGIWHRAIGGRILGLGVAFARCCKGPVARLIVEMCTDATEVFAKFRAEGRAEVVGA